MAALHLDRFIKTTDFPGRRVWLTAATGALVGILSWLFSLFLQWVFIEPVFCQSTDSFSTCANGGTISIVLALAVVSSLGLLSLIRLAVYRPLLIVLASLVTLAGVNGWLGSLSWYEASAWYGLLFAITYVLYAWIARLVSFPVALITMLVIITASRLFIAQL